MDTDGHGWPGGAARLGFVLSPRVCAAPLLGTALCFRSAFRLSVPARLRGLSEWMMDVVGMRAVDGLSEDVNCVSGRAGRLRACLTQATDRFTVRLVGVSR